VNQDAGIGPGRNKGAAVHLRAVRDAFRRLGADVLEIDAVDASEVAAALGAAAGLDLVYERYALGALAGSRFAREHGIAHVVEVNAPLMEEERRYRARALPPGIEFAEREIFSHAACVLAVSNAVARYALARGAAEAAILVRPNGVDTELFRPPDAREPAGRFVLGFHGRLRPWHNFEMLAEAAQRLVREGRDVHLVTVGAGDFAGAAAPHLPAARRTHVDWVEHGEVARLVARFDALPLTYAADPEFYFSPLKLFEAMACGVVPVVPRLGDLAVLVEHERHGLAYDAGDTAQLVAALARLMDEPDLLRRLSRRACARARRHAWVDIARDVLRAVRTAARSPRSRRGSPSDLPAERRP